MVGNLPNNACYIPLLVAGHSDGVDPAGGEGIVAFEPQAVLVGGELPFYQLLRMRHQGRLRCATCQEGE
jgi:hypothetical protein